MDKKVISVAMLALLALGLSVLACCMPKVVANRPYDLNHDGQVDIDDVAAAAFAFGATMGHPRWNADADIDGNGVVDMLDVYDIGSHFGETDS